MTGITAIIDIIRTDVNTAKQLARHASARSRTKVEMAADLGEILEKLENIDRLLGYGNGTKEI